MTDVTKAVCWELFCYGFYRLLGALNSVEGFLIYECCR